MELFIVYAELTWYCTSTDTYGQLKKETFTKNGVYKACQYPFMFIGNIKKNLEKIYQYVRLLVLV